MSKDDNDSSSKFHEITPEIIDNTINLIDPQYHNQLTFFSVEVQSTNSRLHHTLTEKVSTENLQKAFQFGIA